MKPSISQLRSPACVQAALDEFAALGRNAFLQKYAFGPSRDYLVRNPRTGELCDSKAIVGAAFSYQFPEHGALHPQDFSGGLQTVVAKLRSLGFDVVRIGEDWSDDEVHATVAAYFEMLRLQASGQPYVKTAFNAELRAKLKDRTAASVEFKHHNISAILNSLDLPYIPGYKPRGHAQLLLLKVVQQHLQSHQAELLQVIDALQEVAPPNLQRFKAQVVSPPTLTPVEPPALGLRESSEARRPRLPRKIDFALRDEANRQLGRAGEQWTLTFEQRRLSQEGRAELFERVDWVSDRLGDGAGYDILSYDSADQPRYIEVKTTNGGHASSFIISHNELSFSREVGDAFVLYRLFDFRGSPALYMLRGDVSRHAQLDPIDYRASFRRAASGSYA